MDSNAIEAIAVNSVKRLFERSEVVSTFISQNDKEPLWDGHLYLYGSGGRKNENLRGRIPAQVKGKLMKALKNPLKYPVAITALKNYRRDGGIIYFVTQIVGDAEYVFYKELSPVIIASILKTHKGKKEVSLSFSPMPDTLEEREALIVEMYANFRRQKVVATQDPISYDKMKDLKVTGFSFNVPNPDKNKSIFELVTEKPLYLYANFENGFPSMPMEGGPCELTLEKTVEADVKVDGKCYFNSYNMSLSKDELTVSVDDIVCLRFPRKKTSETIDTKLTYKSKVECLSQAINRLEFFMALAEGGKISFGSQDFEYAVKNENLTDTREQLDFLHRADAALSPLGIQEELVVGNLTDSDCYWIDFLDRLSQLDNGVELSDDIKGVRKIRIGNLTLLLFFFNDGKNGRVRSVFDKTLGLEVKYKYPEGTLKESIFSALSKEDYAELGNVPYEDMLASFESIRGANRHVEGNMNFLGLKLLEACDSLATTNNRKQKMLEAAKGLFDYLESEFGPGQSDMYFVNRCQTVMRLYPDCTLEEESMSRLNKILYVGESEKLMKCAAAMLMKNEYEFRQTWDALAEEERERIKKFPIWRFSLLQKEHTTGD